MASQRLGLTCVALLVAGVSAWSCSSKSLEDSAAPMASATAEMPGTGGAGMIAVVPMDPPPNPDVPKAAGEGMLTCRPTFTPPTVPAMGKIIYVAKTGKDTNDGSQLSPLASVSKAAELAQPGDTVLVREGIYRGRVAPARGGVEGMPITYMAEPGKTVVLRGSDEWKPTWEPVPDRPNVFKAVPDVAMFTDASQADGANPLEIQRKDAKPGMTLGQVFLDSERMVQQQALNDIWKRPGTWHYLASEKAIYLHFPDGKAPGTAMIELTTQRRVFAPHVRGLGYITLSGFTIEHAANQNPGGFYEGDVKRNQAGMVGVRSGHHWIIENNIIRFANSLGIDCGVEGMPPDIENVDQSVKVPSFPIIRNNVISDNGTGGMMCWRVQDAQIVNNVFERNNHHRETGPESAAIKFHGSQRAQIIGNLFRNNLAFGMYTDNGDRDARIRQNVFLNNMSAGVFVELPRGTNNTVDNNIIVGNIPNGVYTHNSSAVHVLHNLIANNTGDDDYGAHGEGYFLRKVGEGTQPPKDHLVVNNIFAQNKGGAINIPYTCGGTINNISDYNVYSETLPRPFFVNGYCPDTQMMLAPGLQTLVFGGLGAAAPASISELGSGQNAVGLNLAEWRAFWASQGETHDAKSVLSPGVKATVDPQTLKLSLMVDFDPTTVGSQTVAPVTSDFLDKPVPQDGTAKPGPFQDLVQGQNEFQLYKCAP